jgi:hypothetical protein
MKTVTIVLVVILIAFAFVQLYFINAQRNIETYSYVIKKNISNLK